MKKALVFSVIFLLISSIFFSIVPVRAQDHNDCWDQDVTSMLNYIKQCYIASTHTFNWQYPTGDQAKYDLFFKVAKDVDNIRDQNKDVSLLNLGTAADVASKSKDIITVLNGQYSANIEKMFGVLSYLKITDESEVNTMVSTFESHLTDVSVQIGQHQAEFTSATDVETFIEARSYDHTIASANWAQASTTMEVESSQGTSSLSVIFSIWDCVNAFYKHEIVIAGQIAALQEATSDQTDQNILSKTEEYEGKVEFGIFVTDLAKAVGKAVGTAAGQGWGLEVGTAVGAGFIETFPPAPLVGAAIGYLAGGYIVGATVEAAAGKAAEIITSQPQVFGKPLLKILDDLGIPTVAAKITDIHSDGDDRDVIAKEKIWITIQNNEPSGTSAKEFVVSVNPSYWTVTDYWDATNPLYPNEYLDWDNTRSITLDPGAKGTVWFAANPDEDHWGDETLTFVLWYKEGMLWWTKETMLTQQKETFCSSPPKPVITSVDYAHNVMLGSAVNIDVYVRNDGFTAAWQTIAISFPASQPLPTKISIVESDLNSYGPHIAGEPISAAYSTKTVTLQTYLIEGASPGWFIGDTHYLKISVTPSTAGTFTFYVKSVAATWGVVTSGLASRWTPDKSTSTTLDQQEEFVKVYAIQVGGVANELSDAIVVNKESLLSVSTTGDPRAFHAFTSPVGYLTATEGDTFLIISTGIAANIPGSPELFESTDFGLGGPAGDTASLTLKLLVPSGATTLSFDFRFMSEEYPEYVGSQYNDFFYAYLTDSAGTRQVAFDDNGHIINVNNNFFNPNIYPIGTVFDGSTKRLTTTVNVNEGETITLQLMAGDVGDGIFDTAVFLDNVRFNVGPTPPGTTPTADAIVVKNAPNSVEQGKQFTYTINYFNIEEGIAKNVAVVDNLPSQVTFVSASSGGFYSSSSHSVTWNLGTMQPFSSGSLTLTVVTPSNTPIGTLLQNIVSISTTSQESNSNNNQYTKSTTVSGSSSLPPNIEIGPTVSNYNGIPVLYWTTPITFTYHGDATVIGIDINIHLPDGGPDIGGPMTNTPGTYNWIFTYTFYPRHGQGTVTYTVHYADGHQSTTAHSILVDPSGYVYNAITGHRIQGATVTLYRFDIVLQQFVLIAPNDLGIEPHTNPQITDENGGYGWMVSPGMYMVRVEKTGYATNFVIVTVPPSATDLNIPLTSIDATPPTTKILMEGPHYIDAIGNTYVTSATSFTLIADDGPDGSGVAATYYRQYNATQDSNWKEQPNPFYMTGMDDGNYSIDYYSTDVAGNVEPANTQNITVDNTPPTTAPSIGDPKYTSGKTYVTPDTPFTLTATDAGSGVKLTTYRITDSNGYDSGWLTYAKPFNLTLLGDGNYTIAYNSTDNVGNVEATHQISITLFSWNFVFKDSDGRGTTLKVNMAYKFFQFIAPNKDFGLRYDAKMIRLCKQVLIRCYEDEVMRLTATAVDDKTCLAVAWDKQTCKAYWLIEHPPVYKLTVCCKDINGKAISSASVYLNGCCQGQTDSNGNLMITNVFSGTYTVTVKKCGYKDSSGTVNVTGDANLILTMTPQTYTLTVFCKDSKGRTVSGANVYTNGNYQGVTDSSGKLTITNITAGTCTVTAKESGYKDTSVSVSVSGDKTITITMKQPREK